MMSAGSLVPLHTLLPVCTDDKELADNSPVGFAATAKELADDSPVESAADSVADSLAFCISMALPMIC